MKKTPWSISLPPRGISAEKLFFSVCTRCLFFVRFFTFSFPTLPLLFMNRFQGTFVFAPTRLTHLLFLQNKLHGRYAMANFCPLWAANRSNFSFSPPCPHFFAFLAFCRTRDLLPPTQGRFPKQFQLLRPPPIPVRFMLLSRFLAC